MARPVRTCPQTLQERLMPHAQFEALKACWRGAEIWGFRESIILSGGIHITSLITLLFNLGCTTVRKITIVE
jgi:hypothetical protein